MKNIRLNESIDDGALSVVEQIPGLVKFADQTDKLRLGESASEFCAFLFIFVLFLGRPTSSIYFCLRTFQALFLSGPPADTRDNWSLPADILSYFGII